MFSEIDFIDEKEISSVVLKTLKQYRKRYEVEKETLNAADAKEETLNDKKLLVQRVENSVVNQIANEIEDQYNGEFYIWLPSDADIPDPEHQLNYGKKFKLGDGEKPGDRYGCRCGMDILVKDTNLNLGG